MTTSVSACPAAAPEVKYAGFWMRLFASLVDLSITFLIFFAVAIILPILLGPRLGVLSGGVIFALGLVLWLVVTWLYWALMESSSKQGTFGKDMLGIVVTDAEGKRISFRKATVRYFGKMVSAVPVMAGFLMAGFTARKQGLHDLIAGSQVVLKQ